MKLLLLLEWDTKNLHLCLICLARSGPVISDYTIYGIITGALSSNYSWASYKYYYNIFCIIWYLNFDILLTYYCLYC